MKLWSRGVIPKPEELFEQKKRLQEILEELRRAEDKALDAYDDKYAELFFDLRRRLIRFHRAFGKERTTPEVSTYLVSSLFLRECLAFLTPTPDEQIHYVTGSRANGILTLERRVEFELERQSPVYVKGKVGSTHKALIGLEDHGHCLHGWFHSHPGQGPDAVLPSSTDLNHQERLERGGYPAIGAIFGRDGHVHFFSFEQRFNVAVYGEGVEEIDEQENIFRLVEVG